MAASMESTFVAVLVLLSPLFLATPLSFAWKWWTGMEPEHEHYREKVRVVLDSGIPLSRYRPELDAEARKVYLDPDRQARIESDLLNPLGVTHFILFPALIAWPILFPFSIIIGLLAWFPLKIFEWILIEKKILLKIANLVKKTNRWQIIGIPRSDIGIKTSDRILSSIHRMPITVFLGLFSFLLVMNLHWLAGFSIKNTILVSSLLYIILVSFISVIRAATASALSFADISQRKVIPMDSLVESWMAPWVGVGLVFFLVRQLTFSYKAIREDTLFVDPIIFSLSILLVLYTATIIGLMIEVTFFRNRANDVRTKFQHQVIEVHNPRLYLFTQHLGDLKISPLMSLDEWLQKNESFDSSDFDSI